MLSKVFRLYKPKSNLNVQNIHKYVTIININNKKSNTINNLIAHG